MTDRTSRSADTRAKKARRKTWQPPSMLDAPEAPEGYKHRWLRAEVRGHDDKANMAKRIREGFEPVRAEDHPEFDSPTVDDGKHAGIIGVGGLVLAKVPEETVEESTEYFARSSQEQLQGGVLEMFNCFSNSFRSICRTSFRRQIAKHNLKKPC